LGLLEVQSVVGSIVMSSNVTFFPLILANVPIALNWTTVGVANGAVVGTQVGLADARGVNVGVAVTFVLVGKGVAVAEGGGPFAITMIWSAGPGAGVGVGALLPLPPQPSQIAPKTNNPTGAITRHLSHRDNIK
jgi:hypothetical protein